MLLISVEAKKLKILDPRNIEKEVLPSVFISMKVAEVVMNLDVT
jgi:hypothetical protein